MNIATMDVFSRLMMDRIIFLGVPDVRWSSLNKRINKYEIVKNEMNKIDITFIFDLCLSKFWEKKVWNKIDAIKINKKGIVIFCKIDEVIITSEILKAPLINITSII